MAGATLSRKPADEPVRHRPGHSQTGPVVQPQLRVSQSSDPAEREAVSTARSVVGMAHPAPAWGISHPSSLMRAAEAGGATATQAPADVASGIAIATGGGMPLPEDVRAFMEPRFRADFRRVRVHTDAQAATLARKINARAFTYGSDIFFAEAAYQPNTADGAELIAHELTHTIQQNAAVQRSEAPVVTQHSPPALQRFGLSDVLDYFADKANLIPGFRLFTLVLGVNPVNMRRVDRSAANLLRALIEVIPGGALIATVLDSHGVFARAGAWIEVQLAKLGSLGAMVRAGIDRFLDSLGWRDVFHLGDVWDRAKRIFEDPVTRLLDFGRNLVVGILTLVKDAILAPLARLASASRGWDLLCAVLGRNPITGEAVPRTAETLIGGFMKLIGQQEIWADIKRANAQSRAWAWFQGALAGLLAFVRQVPQLFLNALSALTFTDIVLLPRAFVRVGAAFGDFAGRFIVWAGGQVMSLLEIIFEVVAPGVMVYLRRAASAFRTIIRDPVRFIRNLVRAGIQGFRQFAANFLTHLRTSIVGWLTGAMSGANIYIPQSFSLGEMVKFILSVLGLTWQNIRQKLVRVMGERAVAVLETTFDIVVTLVREGPAAAWQRIVEAIGNLRDMVMEQVMAFVRTNIVIAAVTKLISSLNPVGAFVQAVIAIYNTVMFFVERIRQIGQVAAAVIDSISAIAAGNVAAAANRVEQTMAGLLTLVISFLARIMGLGRVSDTVTNIVNRVRQPVDRALDRVVDWLTAQARRLGSAIVSGAQRVVQWWRARRAFQQGGETHNLHFEGNDERTAVLSVSSQTVTIRTYITNQVVPNVPTNHPKYGNIARIYQHVTRIEELKAGSYGATAGAEITEKFNTIGTLLAELGDTVPETGRRQAKTRSIHGSLVGEGVTIFPLTRVPGPNVGTAPREVTPLWNAVNRRANTYVRGHLLNHHLFGPGTNENMVPITRSLNGLMSSRIEEPVKREVFEHGAIIRYEVSFSFGSRGGTRTIPEETQLPTAVTVVAKKKNLSTGRFAEFATFSEPHTLPPDGPLTGVRPRLKRLALNAPDAGATFPPKRDALSQLQGVGDVRLGVMVQVPNGYYSSWAAVDTLTQNAKYNPTSVTFTGMAANWQGQTSEVDGKPLVSRNGQTIWQY